MSVKGFKLKDGTTAKYDYEALDNLPVIPSASVTVSVTDEMLVIDTNTTDGNEVSY